MVSTSELMIGKTQRKRPYTYRETLVASQNVNWRIEDIIGGDKRLDFTKPFMPESLARVEPLSFLTPDEKLVLNQIRGNTYLCIFGVVEEFILPFVMDHVRPMLASDDYRVRALLQFASEEAKHIQLFRCFREEFARLWQRLRDYRASRGDRAGRSGAPPARRRAGDSADRVDDAEPLSGQR